MSKPTGKQLAYLRSLANRTGTTFVPPRDRRQASREIQRLRGLPREARAGAEPADDEPYGTAPSEEELPGWGASASWRGARTSSERATSLDDDGKAPDAALRLAEFRAEGRAREIVCVHLSDGARLVVDRLATGEDARLLARLEPDEPPENAGILAGLYLQDRARGRCRQLTPGDTRPVAKRFSGDASASTRWARPLGAGRGLVLQLALVASAEQPRGLRWTIRRPGEQPDRALPVSLRRVVALLEDYEPATSMTIAALRAHAAERGCSLVALRGELGRLHSSPIVLNRKLREQVQRSVTQGGLTMSEIALRCGRVKRDKRGVESGETSWLGRRVGLMPEAGCTEPTPWVHTDVLALIAREGLGLRPAECELQPDSSCHEDTCSPPAVP